MPFVDLPSAVTEWIAGCLGGPIGAVADQHGGFSPGIAAVVTTSAGSRGFVKAVSSSVNAESLRFHRAENAVMARLPKLPCVVSPIATASLDVDGAEWEVAVFPVIDGSTPGHPWTLDDTVRVLDAAVDLGALLTPSPWPDDPVRTERLLAFFRGWRGVAGDDEDGWRRRPWVADRLDELLTIEADVIQRLPGDTLSHCDLRADNVMVAGDQVWFVDWAHAGNAARWLDPLLVLCDVVVSGADVADGGDVDVAALLADHAAFRDVDEGIAVGVMASLAATLHSLSRLPDPPGLPTIRRFQDLTAETLLRFVMRRRPS